MAIHGQLKKKWSFIGARSLRLGQVPGLFPYGRRTVMKLSNFVSKEHCVIDLTEEGYRIMDINQGNGTYLNQEKMVTNIYYPLKRGDQISIQKIGGPGINYLVL